MVHNFFLVACCLLSAPLAAGSPQVGKPGVEQEGPRTFAFAFDKAPWPKVLEWLSDITGMPLITPHRPKGTFTFVPQTVDGKPRKYEVSEIIDILNDALEGQNYLIIRRHASVAIYSPDDLIENPWACQVEDLPSLATSQMARIRIQLRSVPADVVAPAVKRQMGPWSQVVPIEEANQLILIDMAGRLRTLSATLRDIEDRRSEFWWTYKCRWGRAGDIAARLGPLLRERREPILLGVNEAANTIVVNAPPAKLALAKAAVGLLDVPRGPWLRRIGQPMMLKLFPVLGGGATKLAKVLQEIYQASPWIRLAPIGEAFILAYAPPADLMEIAPLIAPAAAERIVFDSNVAGADFAEMLNKMMDAPANGPDIQYDPVVNGILV
jgi:hypothetical protein